MYRRSLTTRKSKLVRLRRLSKLGTEIGLTTKSTQFCAVLPRNITCTHKKKMIKRKNISVGVLCTCGKKTPITEEARKYNRVV